MGGSDLGDECEEEEAYRGKPATVDKKELTQVLEGERRRKRKRIVTEDRQAGA